MKSDVSTLVENKEVAVGLVLSSAATFLIKGELSTGVIKFLFVGEILETSAVVCADYG